MVTRLPALRDIHHIYVSHIPYSIYRTYIYLGAYTTYTKGIWQLLVALERFVCKLSEGGVI